MAKNFAVNVGKTGIKTIGDITESLSSRMETVGAPNVDNINFMTGSKSGATDSKVVYNPQKNYDDLVDSKPQKSVKISSTVDEPDLSKLEVTGTDGNSYVLVGDRLVPKEMAEIRGYVLKEGDEIRFGNNESFTYKILEVFAPQENIEKSFIFNIGIILSQMICLI